MPCLFFQCMLGPWPFFGMFIMLYEKPPFLTASIYLYILLVHATVYCVQLNKIFFEILYYIILYYIILYYTIFTLTLPFIEPEKLKIFSNDQISFN